MRSTIKKVNKLTEEPIILFKLRKLRKIWRYKKLDRVLFCWLRRLLLLLVSGIQQIKIRSKQDFWNIIEIWLKMEWQFLIKVNWIFSKNRMVINLRKIIQNGFNFIHSKFKLNHKKTASQRSNHFNLKINSHLWKKCKIQTKRTSMLKLNKRIKERIIQTGQTIKN